MGDLVVGARSGPGEPEGQGLSVGAVEEGAVTVNPDGPPGDDDSPEKPGEESRGEPTDDRPPATPGDSVSDAADGAGAAVRGHGPDGPDGKGTQHERAEKNVRDGSGKPKKPQRSFWVELPILIVIALILALLIKTFLVQAFSIPSDSMQNTLKRGDRVLVDKFRPWFGWKPSRGDVVVFHDPGGWLNENPPTSSNPIARGIQSALSFIGLMPSAQEKDLIKRVIAVGGDTIECKRTGPVVVNGKPLSEPYIFPGNTPCGDKPFGPITIPPNRIWVMGDHRQDSLDSRYHQDLPGGGTVSDNEVVGRAILIVWPINRWTTLPVPATFSQPGIDAAVPTGVGFVGAVPLVLLRRRRLLKKAARDPLAPPA